MKENLIYQAEDKVHTYEIDFRGRARLSSFLNYPQDSAGAQALELGFLGEALFRPGLTWVLSRYHLKIESYLLLGEKIIVSTWFSGRREFFGLRDDEVSDSYGQRILAATRSWIVINLEPEQLGPIRSLEDNFEPLSLSTSVEREREFPGEINHLDLNGHGNNVVSGQWAVESGPTEILWKQPPLENEISYKAEVVWDHRLILRLYRVPREENEFWPQIVFDQNTRELAWLRARWLANHDWNPSDWFNLFYLFIWGIDGDLIKGVFSSAV